MIDREQLSDEYPGWFRAYTVRKPEPDATPGTIDPTTGLPVEDTVSGLDEMETVLECPADLQDAGESRPRSAAGMPTLNADATVFIPDEEQYVDQFLALEPDFGFEYTYPNGTTADGEILFVRQLDTSLLVKFR